MVTLALRAGWQLRHGSALQLELGLEAGVTPVYLDVTAAGQSLISLTGVWLGTTLLVGL